jgi:hypothetical protein
MVIPALSSRYGNVPGSAENVPLRHRSVMLLLLQVIISFCAV